VRVKFAIFADSEWKEYKGKIATIGEERGTKGKERKIGKSEDAL